MLRVSLLLNLAVLLPVCVGLLRRAPRFRAVFGEPSPARGILLSVYLAIFAASALLLVAPDARMATALLGVQVFYKLTTPFTVGSLRNPVVLSNLAIAAVHLATLATLRGA